MGETVLVTGGSGFVASHLVLQLLERGYQVRTTVRRQAAAAKVAPLLEMAGRYPGRLTLAEADLLKPGSFDEPAGGCAVVFHVAAPFRMPEKISDGRAEMLEPALEGTRNVLASVDQADSVRRVVLTSTVGAIFGDYIDVLAMDGQRLSERYFNTTSTLENNPYHYAKTRAEQEAWRLAQAQDRWSMVAINPGLVLGPSLTPASESGSLFLLDELLKGYFCYGAANFCFTIADVRDVALAHIEAAERPRAAGRYIVARPEMLSFLEISRIIRPSHRRGYLLPRGQVPDWVVRLIGARFGLSQDYIRKHLGIRFTVDNQRSVRDLGLSYRPAEQTLIDHYASWASQRSAARKKGSHDRPGDAA
jgi:nucleoside-diphosphate-sugar epimerase